VPSEQNGNQRSPNSVLLNFTSPFILCILIIDLTSKKFPTIMHCLMVFKKVLQSCFIVQRVSAIGIIKTCHNMEQLCNTFLKTIKQCIIVGKLLDINSVCS
jgi:hypothetical protein